MARCGTRCGGLIDAGLSILNQRLIDDALTLALLLGGRGLLNVRGGHLVLVLMGSHGLVINLLQLLLLQLVLLLGDQLLLWLHFKI